MFTPITDFSALEAFWRDPTPFLAEKEIGQAQIDALFVDHDNRNRAKQEARWKADGEA